MLIAPDPEEASCADVMVDATIAGRPYRLRLDTGAARTELVTDDYLAFLPAHDRVTSSGVFGIQETQDVVTVTGLVIGQLCIDSADVVRVSQAPGRPHLLGMDVLQRYCCQFRFDSGLLELAGSPAPAAAMPLHLDNRGHVYVELSWAGVTARACWDSGAAMTVADQDFIAANPQLFTAAGTSTDSTGATFATPVYQMTGPEIGGIQFGQSPVAAVDLAPMNQGISDPMAMVAGYPLLSQANWLFDLPARRWAAPELPGS
jgi:hypothetical protein